jgi:hypothetical protein
MPTAGHHIHYLKRSEIDGVRWDDCIAGAANRLVYGFTWYLDAMTGGQWNALVWDDYQAVMPLTSRCKWGISYLYQPAFTQQTGIFSRSPIPPETVETFLSVAARYYRFAEIFLNYGNPHPSLSTHENLILPLKDPYPILQDRYKKDLTRNLRIAASSGLSYTPDFDLGAAIEAYRSEYASRHPAIRPGDYTRFYDLCKSLRSPGISGPAIQPGSPSLILRAALNGSGLCATALLIRDANRIYLLQSTTPPAGRKLAANHFLIDQLVREFAGTGLILDFEGSDLPGIAYFYANFGALRQPYFFHRHNRLTWPWRLLKS